jgi:diaminohydroxyphosphoribosylaminopyrimidine deaminase/5-amino-6-(5-phosphoribosylamino)uracil reductase
VPHSDPEVTAADHRHMAHALELARRGYYSTHPNPRVGCVIVQGDEVVGAGFHHHAGGPHAEVGALAAAGGRARGATAYVTLEPCSHHGRTPPCADALVAAGVARVVFAAGDSNPRVAGGGRARLEAAGIAVTGGVLAAESRALNRGFFSRMERGRPFVTLKLGMSLDGKVALASGASQWVTGVESRADVQRLRAASDCVLTGIGTVRTDDPGLDVRDPRFDLGPRRQLRAVLDTRLAMSPQAKILTRPGRTLVFSGVAELDAIRVLEAAGAEVEVIGRGPDGVALSAALARLAAREVNDVLIEAGPRLAGAFVAAGLVDEYVLYLAPKLLGHTAQSAFEFADPGALARAPALEILSCDRIGADLRVVARPGVSAPT